MEQLTTGIAYCKAANGLLDALSDAIRELIQLHEDQFQAVISGDADSQRFDDLIHMAGERKNQAKYAYLDHVELHGCSNFAWN